jgi:hypothetical protein
MTNEFKTKIFNIKSPPTVMEIIDSEAVIINGEKGYYYNLSKQASLILQSLLDGHNLGEIFSFNNFDIDTCKHIEKMVDMLIAEDILTEITDIENKSSLKKIKINDFQKEIVLTVYDDMKDMLALDPIHEADEIVGWPNKK